MNDLLLYFSIAVVAIILQCHDSLAQISTQSANNSSELFSTGLYATELSSTELYSTQSSSTELSSTEPSPITPDDDIYKCVSYTGAHVDISHLIGHNFSEYKDCQTSDLYTFNRRDRRFKIDINVQRSWIVEVSALIQNGTIRPICGLNSDQFAIRPTESCETNGIQVNITTGGAFETLSLYYDLDNLTIITTHNKLGEPLHFNVNVWQTGSSINESYGLCKGPTCSSEPDGSRDNNKQIAPLPSYVIPLICDIYIDNYLNSTMREPSERSLHYNRTIENVRRACLSDVERSDWPHAAAGGLEVLFVEDRINSENITTMADIQRNFQTNLENELVKLRVSMDLSRQQVDNLIAQITTTTMTSIEPSSTTTSSNSTIMLTSTTTKANNNMAAIIGGSVAGGIVLVVLIVVLIVYIRLRSRRTGQAPSSDGYAMSTRNN